GYRLRKFMRRHKGGVIVASLLCLALLGAALGTVFGVIEAEHQRVANSLREVAERDRDAAELARGDALTARKDAERARDGETQEPRAAEKARDGERTARAEAEKARDLFIHFEYGRTIQVAHQEWRDNNVAGALTLLNGTREDLRGWEWHYIHRLC